MFKFVLVVLAVLAVASAQYIVSPYYRTGGLYGYGAYPYASGYTSGYAAAVPYAYHGGLGYGYTGAYYG